MSKSNPFSIPKALNLKEFSECFNSDEDNRPENEVLTDPNKIFKLAKRIEDANEIAQIEDETPIGSNDFNFPSLSTETEVDVINMHFEKELGVDEDLLRLAHFGNTHISEGWKKRQVSGHRRY